MNIRPPAVAGQFYPGQKSEIINEIEYSLEQEKNQIDLTLGDKHIMGGVSPHAGYVFCLPEAVHLFQILRSSSQEWERIVLLNPNHTGKGAPLAIDGHERWSTPMGQVDVDRELGKLLIERSLGTDYPINWDSVAHRYEHSGEVIVPLLQYFLPLFNLLPLCMGDCSLGAVSLIAKELCEYAEKSEREPLILASSDFTHFKTPSEGQVLDDYALEAILALDTESFLKRVKSKRLSICGFGPIAVLLEYAKKRGRNPKVSLLKRGHSGESFYFDGREQQEVVDYISLLVYED
jgi:MEMO1 family protein